MPWYVGAIFYSDSTFVFLLGGANQQINIPLESQVSINWTLSYSSSDILESSYPNFAISNFRAYRNGCP